MVFTLLSRCTTFRIILMALSVKIFANYFPKIVISVDLFEIIKTHTSSI